MLNTIQWQRAVMAFNSHRLADEEEAGLSDQGRSISFRLSTPIRRGGDSPQSNCRARKMTGISRERGSARLVQALILVISCVMLSACSAPDAELTWVEPVQLASGETVKIRRHVSMIQQRAWGGGFASAPIYRASSIELIDSISSFPVWDAPLVPIVMDRDLASGEWVIIASVNDCGFWERNGKPVLPYWAFRLRDGEWYRAALPQLFVGRVANLFVEFDAADSSGELKEHVVARKLRQSKEPRHAPHYTRIDPSPQKFYEGCGKAGDAPAGLDHLDLQNFKSLP